LFADVISIPTLESTGFSSTFNAGSTFSAIDNPSGIVLSDTTPTLGANIRGVAKTYPSVPFTATMLVSLPVIGQIYQGIGFVALNSLTGALINWYLLYTPANGITVWDWIINSWTNPTTFNANVASAVGAAFNYGWLRYQDNGTNINFSASNDGVNFLPIYSLVKANSLLGATGFNFFGLMLSIGGIAGGIPLGTTVMSYSETTP
jgi:hypothetical protein